mmetsp:Transcript_101459/g.293500  ORF Transcript_101459/g.293500 Transcript_101459/m.293500 type:complete len:177 (+) Transcript_101459:79-609(+)
MSEGRLWTCCRNIGDAISECCLGRQRDLEALEDFVVEQPPPPSNMHDLESPSSSQLVKAQEVKTLLTSRYSPEELGLLAKLPAQAMIAEASAETDESPADVTGEVAKSDEAADTADGVSTLASLPEPPHGDAHSPRSTSCASDVESLCSQRREEPPPATDMAAKMGISPEDLYRYF